MSTGWSADQPVRVVEHCVDLFPERAVEDQFAQFLPGRNPNIGGIGFGGPEAILDCLENDLLRTEASGLRRRLDATSDPSGSSRRMVMWASYLAASVRSPAGLGALPARTALRSVLPWEEATRGSGVGRLVPEDYPLGSLGNEAERQVVAALRDGLDDRWLILPSVKLHLPDRDRELDVVLLHPTFGVLDIEVKGHRAELRKGRWYAHNKEMVPQPTDQARHNAYALRGLIRDNIAGQEHIGVEYLIALPNTSRPVSDLPPGGDWVNVLTGETLDDPDALTERIEILAFSRTVSAQLSDNDVGAIVALLCPDIEFGYDPTARMRRSRANLDELCATQIGALERLDANRRVVALGAAGTGKTRLAMAWARRAFAREERVLLTCYNDPLGGRIAEQLPEDPDLVIGSFLRLALAFDGMAPLTVPDDADHDWWTITAVGHLHSHWHEVTERFDTIVIDEAQDFSPAWLAQLEALLDPDGPRRLLIAADVDQELYARGFQVPSADAGWTHCELVANCRNAQEIGRLLRRHLGGAPAPARGPLATDLRLIAIQPGAAGESGSGDASADVPESGSAGEPGSGSAPADASASGSVVEPAAPATIDDPSRPASPRAEPAVIAAAVRAEIDRLVLDEERDPDEVAVLTFSSRLRNHLLADAELVRWEQRHDGLLCENVHRVKGLEFDTVILVADSEIGDDLLYVGISRAVSELIIVAPASVATRLGLKPSPAPM